MSGAQDKNEAFRTPVEPGTAGPWARCWAKLIDLWLAAGIVFALWRLSLNALQHRADVGPLAAFLANDQSAATFWALYFSVMAASFLLDALVQFVFGVTPGLAITGARLRTVEGGRLSLIQALGRNLDVWIWGFWITIPWIPMFRNNGRLASGGTTRWDERWGTRVFDHDGGNQRSLVGGVCFCILIGVYLWLLDRLQL